MFGRCIPEIIRALNALQTADKYRGATPANWVEGEPIIQKSPTTFEELLNRTKEIDEKRNGMSWYLSFKNTNDEEK